MELEPGVKEAADKVRELGKQDGNEHMVVLRDGVEVWHGRMDGRRVCTGPTEPAAIVAALEVAPNV